MACDTDRRFRYRKADHCGDDGVGDWWRDRHGNDVRSDGVRREDTTFYYPEAKLGTTAGGISSLVTRMPHKLAMEIMLLLGSKVAVAQRACYDVGFVNWWSHFEWPTGETVALEMAAEVGIMPLVIGALELRLVAQCVMPVGPIERMVGISQTIARVRQSEDMQEGIAAYKEKRKPQFKAR